ncbi:MAG TPA: hypothetical protein PJ991_00265 [Kiritimatiellia bacterium]|nr:hypothetical protein [Kiritimatiellia bacterium]
MSKFGDIKISPLKRDYPSELNLNNKHGIQSIWEMWSFSSPQPRIILISRIIFFASFILLIGVGIHLYFFHPRIADEINNTLVVVNRADVYAPYWYGVIFDITLGVVILSLLALISWRLNVSKGSNFDSKRR